MHYSEHVNKFIYLNFIKKRGNYYYPHFTDEESEAERNHLPKVTHITKWQHQDLSPQQ